MAIIACIGWGSLVWDPRELPIKRQWFTDGPFAKVEFLRQSDNGRITLVLDSSADAVRCLWSVMDTTNLDEAREALRKRECIGKNKSTNDIGSWSRDDTPPELIIDISQWAQSRGIDSVVWTALPCKFGGKSGEKPTEKQVIDYLTKLTGRVREDAERYIRFAPKQIDTPYRRKIEASLQWTPLAIEP